MQNDYKDIGMTKEELDNLLEFIHNNVSKIIVIIGLDCSEDIKSHYYNYKDVEKLMIHISMIKN